MAHAPARGEAAGKAYEGSRRGLPAPETPLLFVCAVGKVCRASALFSFVPAISLGTATLICHSFRLKGLR